MCNKEDYDLLKKYLPVTNNLKMSCLLFYAMFVDDYVHRPFEGLKGYLLKEEM